ncbi:MAG: tRNA (adenosine(37)-N6)-dimethylallyltransferase MiaA [Pseudomonadales bacterium]
MLAIVGPTAAGKTAAALTLADRFPLALISLDSALVYRGLDIGTAKPSLEEQRRHPHALIDIRDPSESYSVADFVADADAAVRAARAAGRVPVLVGGTMLYLRAFRDGLAPLPATNPEIRAALIAELNERGSAALYAELVGVDPEAARGIHPNNPQRLLRALEVWRQSGRPLSAHWALQRDTSVRERLGIDLDVVAWTPEPRAELHARIETRLDAMLDAGFVAEVDALRRRSDLHADLPSLRAVGYRQIWEWLDAPSDMTRLRASMLAATRQLARRQLTWIRNLGGIQAAEPARAMQFASDALARAVAAGC